MQIKLAFCNLIQYSLHTSRQASSRKPFKKKKKMELTQFCLSLFKSPQSLLTRCSIILPSLDFKGITRDNVSWSILFHI